MNMSLKFHICPRSRMIDRSLRRKSTEAEMSTFMALELKRITEAKLPRGSSRLASSGCSPNCSARSTRHRPRTLSHGRHEGSLASSMAKGQAEKSSSAMARQGHRSRFGASALGGWPKRLF